MSVPNGFRYTKDHEWLQDLGSGQVRVGISDYAQKELGDVVFVELPAAGTSIKKGQSLGTVESVKAVSDVYAPVSGTVVEVNSALVKEPEAINRDPHGAGWMVVLQPADPSEIDTLLSNTQYEQLLGELAK